MKRSHLLSKLSKDYISVRTLVSVLCDLAVFPLLYLVYAAIIYWVSKISDVLSHLVLNNQQLIANQQLSTYNNVLLQQAGQQTASLFVVILILFCVGWSLLSYIQWSFIHKQSLKIREGLRFIALEGTWLFFMIMVFYLFVGILLKVDYLLPFFFIWLILFVHFTLSFQIQLYHLPCMSVKKLLRKTLIPSLKQVARFGLSNPFCLLEIYLSFIGILFGSIIVSTLLSFIVPQLYGFLGVFLLGLTLWRQYIAHLFAHR